MSELLGADTDVLDRDAESLSLDARRVQEIRTLAQRAVAELQISWNGSDLLQLTQQWVQQTSPLLAAASASLDGCASRLRAQSAAQRMASSSETGGGWLSASGVVPMPLRPPGPPPGQGSPATNATWWTSLSPLQQQRIVREHPGWIGNRNGVDFSARDLANRVLLRGDRDRLRTIKRSLEVKLADDWSAGVLTNDDTALAHVKDKLASIVAIQATLAKPGARQLILLDMGQERTQAAIANGNVQTADNVAVFVPGLSTNVTKRMWDLDENMKAMQGKAEQESGRADPGSHATTATVTWIGYQAPQMGEDLVRPHKTVADDDLAKQGAALLVPFLQGIGAARAHDAHLTLLSHSYGSTTAGIALRQRTGVDDAVFFGSPGLGTSHLTDLRLAPGHAYYIEARQDPVGDLATFGIDPSHMSGIEHISARASSAVDPATGEVRHFGEAKGHGQYLLEESTSQYNMSLVVAGTPERRVEDHGMGFGDVLSWPVPGTY